MVTSSLSPDEAVTLWRTLVARMVTDLALQLDGFILNAMVKAHKQQLALSGYYSTKRPGRCDPIRDHYL